MPSADRLILTGSAESDATSADRERRTDTPTEVLRRAKAAIVRRERHGRLKQREGGSLEDRPAPCDLDFRREHPAAELQMLVLLPFQSKLDRIGNRVAERERRAEAEVPPRRAGRGGCPQHE